MRRSVRAFVESLPSGGLEREYHEAIAQIVSRISFDAFSEAAGFGLMTVLTDGRLAVGAVDTDVHPIAGSVDENSCLMAILFEGVRRPPSWWKASYAVRRSAPDVVAAARWWVQMLGVDSDVVAVEAY